MANDWSELTDLTRGEPFVVERARLLKSGVAVEGEFEPPPLAALPPEDQVFVAAFVRSHGSIKEMERLFGVSYPTVKNRLNRIGAELGFADVLVAPEGAPSRSEVLARLARGEISAREAEEKLRRR